MLHIKDYIKDARAGIAIDVGTRFGEFAESLKEAMPEGSRIIGIDHDERTVAQAREKRASSGIEFAVGRGEALDFADGSVEAAALSNTMHHIEDYDAVIREMIRVLRPGGYLIINEMYSDSSMNAAQETHFAQHTLEAKLDMIAGDYQVPTWSRAELIEKLSKFDLADVQTHDLEESPEMDAKLGEKTAKLDAMVDKIASGRPDHDELMAEAHRVQQMKKEHGIKRCPQLIYIGRKR